MILTRRVLVTVIVSLAALLSVMVAGCNGSNQIPAPKFPTIVPNLPNWLQSTNPKVLTAKVSLPGWDVLAPQVLYNPGRPGSQPARTGDATVGSDGSLSFTIPDDQNGDFPAFTTVSFKWIASFRLHNGGQEVFSAQAEGESPMIGCLPNDLGRTTPLANVVNPSRLTVKDPCVTFNGTIQGVLVQSAPTLDGDTHLWVRPDPGFERFLQPANLGKMVAEIVPADKPSCVTTPVIPPHNSFPLSSFGSCTSAAIADPSSGTHVTITGPLVVDSEHGNWAEIHPIWLLASTPPPPFPTPPLPSRRSAHPRK
jgi:hypothetical protein